MKRLCVTHSVVSRLLQALEGLGLVVRERDSSDRRVKLTYVTKTGLEALALCFADASSRGAQATGERIWLAAWRAKIARNGIRIDSVARARPPRDFHALARWSRDYVPSDVLPSATAAPSPNRELESIIRGMGIDWEAWLRGEWIVTGPPP